MFARDVSGVEECDRLRLRRGQGVRGHGGYPPSQGGSALSHRERDEDVHGHDRVPARAGGDASASTARWKSTCRASFQGAGRSRSGTCSVTARGSRTSRTTRDGSSEAERSPSTSPINTLRFAASKPLAFQPGSQERYSNTNYIALGLVIEKVTGRSYAEELEQRVLDPLGLSRTELPTTRRLADLDDGGSNPNLPWAAGAIVSNAHDLSRFYSALLSGRILSAASLGAMKDTKTYGVFGTGLGIFSTDLACGRSLGHLGDILDYQTLVTASEEGDRVAVVSLRGRGYIPWLGRALLCAEPPLAAGSAPAKSRIAFVSAPRPAVPAPLYVVNADGSGQRMADAYRRGSVLGSAWSPDGRRIAFAEPARRQLRDLRHERRRERAAEADAQPGARLRSRLVARRAEDRLRPRPRPRRATHSRRSTS